MNLENAEEIGRLARHIRDIDAELAWLDEQDNATFPSTRLSRSALSEFGPAPSHQAARHIRAVLRDDYKATRILAAAKLTGLGVKVEPV